MIRNPVISFFATVALTFFLSGCSDELKRPIVAKVGDKVISLEEFALIYQFNPNLACYKNPAQAKRVILSTLIAEKLLAAEQQLTKNNDPSRALREEQFHREAVIEEFWQKKIYPLVTVTEDGLLEAYKKSKIKKIIQYLVFDEAAKARNAYKHIESGVSFDQLAEMYGFSVNSIPTDTITFGSQIPAIEAESFRLQLNEISQPVRQGQQFFLLKLTGEKQDIFTTEYDFANASRQLQKILRRRHGEMIFKEYVQKNISPARHELDRSVFKELILSMEKRIFSTDKILPSLQPGIIYELQPSSKDLFKREVITFSSGITWTVENLLQRLLISPYPVRTTSPGVFRTNMIVASKNLVDDELLYQHALKENLHKTEYVRIHTGMWMDFNDYTEQLREIVESAGIDSANQAIENRLIELAAANDIQIYFSVIDTISLEKTDMLVMKTHFPSRSIAPILKPLPAMELFEKLIFKENYLK